LEKVDTYVCLDDLRELEQRQKDNTLDHTCSSIGITKMLDGKNAIKRFNESLNTLITNRKSITPLKWSDALAYSASMFVKQMEGCSIYANQLWKDGH